jgi:hypothetical protein
MYQSQRHDVVENLKGLLQNQQLRGHYTHLLFNKWDHRYGKSVSRSGADPGSSIDDYISELPKKQNLIVNEMCALGALWMRDVLRAWNRISHRQLIA